MIVNTDTDGRAAHLAWCKRRALEYINSGDTQNGIASMISDLGKHPATADHAGIQLTMLLMMAGGLSTVAEARKHIEGFN